MCLAKVERSSPIQTIHGLLKFIVYGILYHVSHKHKQVTYGAQSTKGIFTADVAGAVTVVFLVPGSYVTYGLNYLLHIIF